MRCCGRRLARRRFARRFCVRPSAPPDPPPPRPWRPPSLTPLRRRLLPQPRPRGSPSPCPQYRSGNRARFTTGSIASANSIATLSAHRLIAVRHLRGEVHLVQRRVVPEVSPLVIRGDPVLFLGLDCRSTPRTRESARPPCLRGGNERCRTRRLLALDLHAMFLRIRRPAKSPGRYSKRPACAGQCRGHGPPPATSPPDCCVSGFLYVRETWFTAPATLSVFSSTSLFWPSQRAYRRPALRRAACRIQPRPCSSRESVRVNAFPEGQRGDQDNGHRDGHVETKHGSLRARDLGAKE